MHRQCTPPHLPKGSLAWKSGIYLANYLVDAYAADPNWKPRRVLELGSGIGLGGVCIDKLHKGREDEWKLVLTDGDDAVLQILQVHLRLNRCQPQTTCEKLSWGTGLREFEERHGLFDFIIAADVVYEESSIRPLLQTVSALLGREVSSRFVLVQEIRFQRLIDETIAIGKEFGLDLKHINHPAPKGINPSEFALLEGRWMEK